MAGRKPGRRAITKAEWVALGGLRNSRLFRVQRGARWHHYQITD